MPLDNDNLFTAAAEHWKKEIEAGGFDVSATFVDNLVDVIKRSSCIEFGYATLRSEYGPDNYLYSAATRSGMTKDVFPKEITIMRIYTEKQEITLKKGLKGEEEVIYPKLANVG